LIVADTNVVSEFMREHPEPSVTGWAGTLAAGDLAITVITVEEIERGLAGIPVGRRRRDLEGRWHQLLDAYADSVLIYDVPAAHPTAQILVNRASAGSPMGLADAQIAGICLSQQCELATRNVRDFQGVDELAVLNPFD
jgi:predicted nucleic acid-binding protein